MANNQRTRKPKADATSTGGVFYSIEYLETCPHVSPKNMAACQHCGASFEHLRRTMCYEWELGRTKQFEGGYRCGCLKCGKQSRDEWHGGKQRKPLLTDGG